VSLVAQHNGQTLTEENKRYDVNNDGRIDSADVREVVRAMQEAKKANP